MSAAPVGKQRKFQAVVFDMDGVVIDSHPAHRQAWQTFLSSLGKEVTLNELDFILDGRKRCEILRYFLGDITREEAAILGKKKDEFFREAALELRLIPGVKIFLDSLRDQRISLGLATSASASRTHFTLRRLNLKGHFQVVVTGDDVDQGKPNPAMYRMACQALAVDPQDAIAIEDAVSGVVAARGAGMKCVGVSRNGKRDQLRDAGASGIIEDFLDFTPDRLNEICF